MTLYAKWDIRYYNVSFNTNGGSSENMYPVQEGMPATRPTGDPIRNGYNFAGWYSDSGLTAVFDFSAPITGVTTVYAKWNIITYNVTYHLNGGTNDASNPSTYTVGGNITLKDPTRSGYTFGGWFLSVAFESGETTGISAGSFGDRTFYAKWNKVPSEGGGGIDTMTLIIIAAVIGIAAVGAGAFLLMRKP
jgi:uncharacterized repeat protein (TIGR02543 family)